MEPTTLTVAELIEKLKKVEGQDAEVFFLDSEIGLICISGVSLTQDGEKVVLSPFEFKPL